MTIRTARGNAVKISSIAATHAIANDNFRKQFHRTILFEMPPSFMSVSASNLLPSFLAPTSDDITLMPPQHEDAISKDIAGFNLRNFAMLLDA